MRNLKRYKILNYGIAIIWLINGLYCKVLHQVPRHQQIVAAILGVSYASMCTILIGIAESLMAVWIITGFKSNINAIIQIVLIGTMNILEFFLVPQLLLWGKLNLLFAFLLMLIIYYNEFKLRQAHLKSFEV